MTPETVKRILDAQENLDPELLREYAKHQQLFLELLHRMPEREQHILIDYLGICLEIHLKLLESIAEIQEY